MSEQNGYAGKAVLLGANKRRFVDIDVPDVGRFRIRSLSELERSKYEAGFLDAKGTPKTARLIEGKIRLIILCVCDVEGLQLMSNADAVALGGVDSVITNVMFEACQDHCGFTNADLEELAGN